MFIEIVRCIRETIDVRLKCFLFFVQLTCLSFQFLQLVEMKLEMETISTGHLLGENIEFFFDSSTSDRSVARRLPSEPSDCFRTRIQMLIGSLSVILERANFRKPVQCTQPR